MYTPRSQRLKETIARTYPPNLRSASHLNQIANKRFSQPIFLTLSQISQKVKHTSMDAMDSIGRRVRHDSRKKKKSSLLQSEEYEFYTPALRRKRALSQQTHDSNDIMYTQNKKMNPGKSSAQQLKQLKEDLINFQAETDRVTQNIVVDYVNTTPETTKLVKIKDILLTQKYLKCLTTPDHSSFAAWVDDDVSANAK